jgi:dihydrofolate reductase
VVTIIVARAANGVIGKRNDLPWYLPEDLARFRKLTAGHPVIMGRKTYESILARVRKPLPGRAHFVLTRTPESYKVPTEWQSQVRVLSSLDQAIAEAEKLDSEVFVIGGENVFREAIDKADKMEITDVHKDYEGDVYFPEFDESNWQKTAEEEHGEFAFVTYGRRS